jgi:hypothetical protein
MKKSNLTEEEKIDEIIYVAGRFAEDYLKKEFENNEFLNKDELEHYVEKFIDGNEETAQWLSGNKQKFEKHLKELKNKKNIRKRFVKYIIYEFQSLDGKFK